MYTLRQWTEHVGGEQLLIEGIDDFDTACTELARRGASVHARYQSLCPMFGVVWPAARGLCRRLSEVPLRGRTVLELGCGLALPALVAARCGARVTATDQHPDTEAFLRRNLELNGIRDVRYTTFDWEGTLPHGVRERSFDHVIGSDVLYTIDMPEVLAAAYERFMGPRGTGWLTDPGRPWLAEFIDACERRGLAVHDDIVAGDDGQDEAFLITLTRRS